MANVIVFGPTGNIASIAAITAQQYGAKVHLAMRDPTKSIPGLTHDQEIAGHFNRVQADLTQPTTVSEAVRSTGAIHAFVYAAYGTRDHMKATFEALKSSGIKLVVYLSSYTIRDRPLTSIPSDEIISWVHAQIELSLEAVYGPDNYIAIRPGGFATNFLRFRDGIAAGDVKLYGGDFTMDCITPNDMGRVAGSMLATGPRDHQRKVYLYGPKVRTQNECVRVICEVLGQDIKISSPTAEQATEHLQASGVPKPVADWMIKVMGGDQNGEEFDRAQYDNGVKNVELYTGRPALEFRDWVVANKQLFSS